MNKLAVIIAVAVALAGGCYRPRAAELPRGSDPALETIARAEAAQDTKAAQEATEKSWIDNVDVDRVFSNPWLIAGVFLLIQWVEIWYFNRTGKKSKTIDAAEAAMQPKLGIVQRFLYWIWRKLYFWKNRDKKDPDEEQQEEEKKK